ncbi:hypothetical protein C8R44DRAFT_981801 [Mycena epipterygia]|nr:hypothetical protein C8R44DRAFT_981801 [Mycena epipterygia]
MDLRTLTYVLAPRLPVSVGVQGSKRCGLGPFDLLHPAHDVQDQDLHHGLHEDAHQPLTLPAPAEKHSPSAALPRCAHDRAIPARFPTVSAARARMLTRVVCPPTATGLAVSMVTTRTMTKTGTIFPPLIWFSIPPPPLITRPLCSLSRCDSHA